MNAGILAFVVLFPILAGALVPVIPYKKRLYMEWYVEGVVLITAIASLVMLTHRPQEAFVLFRLTGNLSLSFQVDGLGTVFAGLISVLWPLATLYSFEYMKKESRWRKTL